MENNPLYDDTTPFLLQACRYVNDIETAPNGETITAEERAAMWWLAFSATDDGWTIFSLAALGVHLKVSTPRAKGILAELERKNVIMFIESLDKDSSDGSDRRSCSFVEAAQPTRAEYPTRLRQWALTKQRVKEQNAAMGVVASTYVKHLKHAPNGEKITTAERLTLWYLADNRPEDQGFDCEMLIGPTPRLCDYVGVQPDEMVQIFSELVRKGILRSVPYVEDDDVPLTTVYYFTDPSLSGRATVRGKTN